jgi:hypothetical protein
MRAITIVLGLASLVLVACGNDNKQTFDAPVTPTPDAPGTPDAMPGPPDASCFTNPTTHYEIINACTNAQFVDKNPNLPLQYADGGLPPLP